MPPRWFSRIRWLTLRSALEIACSDARRPVDLDMDLATCLQPRGAGNVESGLHSYHNQYTREFVEPEAKRPRYEVNNEYHATSAELAGSSLNGHRIHPRTGLNPPCSTFSSSPSPSSSASGTAPSTVTTPSLAAAAPAPNRASRHGMGAQAPKQRSCGSTKRCKQLLTQPPEDADFPDANESIESVTQAAATALTQLAETLSSGISSDERLASLSLLGV
ncbi:hypothetical protein M7I_7914 [Glarea lozoyensis 74030]|uniref:Uncharacterized protein n=1 Tax=Glarea lozoyensis (strain ATCC 74030 / MF5533) TaxID=1104152 RepID=H0EYK8_GLAL7|nr:hypothetical protein M7I_7914 [Glarea lozoyensis 74030]